MSFRAEITTTGEGTSLDPVIVELSGRIDISDTSQLEAIFEQLIDDSGHILHIVSLSGVEYMTSHGLRVLHTICKKCREKGGDVVLARDFSIDISEQIKQQRGPWGILASTGFAPAIFKIVDLEAAKTSPVKQFEV